MISSHTRNLFFFTSLSSIWGIIYGLIGPFYVLYVEKLSGGVEKLGVAFSIMVLLQSASTYVAGHFSDRLGRRPFLFITTCMDATVLFLYTIITRTYQLYLLQGMLGITNGVVDTIRTSLLGDLTEKEMRGKMIGRFNAIVNLSSAAGLSAGGYMASIYGIKSLFYFASISVALSSLLLFFIRE